MGLPRDSKEFTFDKWDTKYAVKLDCTSLVRNLTRSPNAMTDTQRKREGEKGRVKENVERMKCAK